MLPALSVVAEGAPPRIPARFNMAAHVLSRAAQAPERPALRVVGADGVEARLTCGALLAEVRSLAGGLIAQGLAPGDIVLMRLGNTMDYPLVYLAAIAAGMIPVPTSSQLTRAETEPLLQLLRPALVVRSSDVACAAHDRPELTPDALRRAASAPLAQWHMGSPHRPAYIVFTSGTSGVPRAVVHAHRAILARQMMIADWYDLRPQDRLLHAGAFNWTYTMGTGLMDPWTVGAEALVLAPGTSLESLPAIMERERPTIFAAAPGVYRKILKSTKSLDLPDLRHGLSAGEKMAGSLLEDWRAATGRAVHEAFGMSECSTFISGAPHRPAREGFIGWPQRGRKVAVLGPDGAAVARGQMGEIAVSRDDPGLFLGYHGAEAATRARLDGPWFRTGDLGLMAEDGQIAWRGRRDEMMNAGGFRVSPVEVETAIRAHPAVDDCAAVEISVGPATTIIALAYTAERAVAEAELKAFAGARLAGYKRPRIYVHLPELPRGANGKLARRLLRRKLESRL